MIIHGVHSVREALHSRRHKITRLYLRQGPLNRRLSEIVELARNSGIPVHRDPGEALARKAGSPQNQGVVAEIAALEYVDLEDLLASSPDLLLLADGVEDPRNLGAVMRTAESAGVQGLLLPDRHSCGLTSTVVKSSAGAALHLPVARIGNVAQTLQTLKHRGLWAVGLDMTGAHSLEDFDADLPLVIVVGGEDRGLRKLVRARCDFLVSLPQKGAVRSMNLSVAVGVLLYQIVLNRK